MDFDLAYQGWLEQKRAAEYEHWERARMIALFSSVQLKKYPKELTAKWWNPYDSRPKPKPKKAPSKAELMERAKERDAKRRIIKEVIPL